MNFDREEQAFRAAFAEHADEALQPTPLQARRSRPWAWLAAAAAVLGVVAIPLALLRPGGDARPTVAAPASTTAPDASALPPAAEGWQWVSKHGVAAQVPDTWVLGAVWRPYGCDHGVISYPRMDANGWVDPGQDTCPASGLIAPGLRLLFPATVPEGVFASPTAVSREIDGVLVWVGLPDEPTPEQQALAERIVDSAVAFDINQDGCPARPPFVDADSRPAAWDATAPVDAVALCDYRFRDDADPAYRHSFHSSRRVTGDEATRLVATLQQAAPGTTRRTECLRAEGPGLLVRVSSGEAVHDIYVRHDGCGPLSIDDGTTVRQYLPGACEALFGTDSALTQYDSTMPECHDLEAS